jgi:hypothetical protein
LSALFATSFFLIATSKVEEPDGGFGGAVGTNSYAPCSHPYQSVTFHVTGTCGPQGDVTLTSLANDCAISVQGGGDVGLPSAGRYSSTGYGDVSLTASNWVLSGYMPEGAVLPAGGSTDAPFIVVGAPEATGGTSTVAHGSLVKRTCRNVGGSAAMPVSCVHEASAGLAGCNATFTVRK